jgi:hypothetical protein
MRLLRYRGFRRAHWLAFFEVSVDVAFEVSQFREGSLAGVL